PTAEAPAPRRASFHRGRAGVQAGLQEPVRRAVLLRTSPSLSGGRWARERAAPSTWRPRSLPEPVEARVGEGRPARYPAGRSPWVRRDARLGSPRPEADAPVAR